MNIGRQVWTAATPGANGTSEAVDTGGAGLVSLIGNANGATTITLQVSQDGVTWFDGPTQVLAGAGDFNIAHTTGARYVRAKTSAAVTVTAQIGAKR